MRGSKSRVGRMVEFFLLLAAAYLTSGAARAQCLWEGCREFRFRDTPVPSGNHRRNQLASHQYSSLLRHAPAD